MQVLAREQTPEIPQELYTRHEHGNLPVHIEQREGHTTYTLVKEGQQETYPTAKALLKALYGHEVRMSLSAYFKLAPQPQTPPSLLHFFQSEPKTGKKLPAKGKKDPVSGKNSEKKATKGKKSSASWQNLEEYTKSLELELDRIAGVVGVDLGAKSQRGDTEYKADEVRKLLWRGFAGKMLSQGYDPEDILQEVYQGLLVRNQGKCPWDGRKSTFGYYVHMVANCVLTNYHRKSSRRVDKDALSLSGVIVEGEEVPIHAGSCDIDAGSDYGTKLVFEELERFLEELPDQGPEARVGREILPMVSIGMQRSEIVKSTEYSPNLVSRALAWIRLSTAKWAKHNGLKKAVPGKYLTP